MSAELPAGEAIRAYRASQRMSLEQLADKIAGEGCERPSTAKLSRIETGKQPVATDILDCLEKITGIPAKDLRPDLAKHFEAAQ
jgi:transcriptional regulator with XRE-family HTH domain